MTDIKLGGYIVVIDGLQRQRAIPPPAYVSEFDAKKQLKNHVYVSLG